MEPDPGELLFHAAHAIVSGITHRYSSNSGQLDLNFYLPTIQIPEVSSR